MHPAIQPVCIWRGFLAALGFPHMQQGTVILLRLFFLMLFTGTLFAGFWVMKNYDRLCGVDKNLPSENSSARAYSRMQIIVVLAHALVLFGAFVLWVE